MTISFHPALPSIESARANYDQVTSDHTPILVTIPWTKNEIESEKEPIQIISWNVLQTDSYSGFGLPENKGQKFGETDEQKTDRHSRIATSLGQFITANPAVDFITLQEAPVNNDPSLFNVVMAHLGADQWGCVLIGKDQVKSNTCDNITFYNKAKFKPSELQPQPYDQLSRKDSRTDIRTQLVADLTNFDYLDSGRSIAILNVHAPFNRNPEQHETNIKAFLQKETPIKKLVVVGDFNCTFAPLDLAPRNIITSACGPFFSPHDRQTAYAIDGAFYSDNINNNVHCEQAQVVCLNPTTGQPYENSELPPLTGGDLDAFETKEVNQLRPIMAIDRQYEDNKAIIVDNKELTVFEYQEQLRSAFNDRTLIVRPARNLNNGSGISIFFPCDHLTMHGLSKVKENIRYTFLANLTDGFQFTPLSSEEEFSHMQEKGSPASYYYQISALTPDISKLAQCVLDHATQKNQARVDVDSTAKKPRSSCCFLFNSSEEKTPLVAHKKTESEGGCTIL